MIDAVKDRSQCRGFSGTGFTRHKYDALMQSRKLENYIGDAELLKIRNMIAENSECGADMSLLVEEIDTAALGGNGSGKVDLPGLLQFSKAVTGQLLCDAFALLIAERCGPEIDKLSVHAAFRRQAIHNVYIRCMFCRCDCNQVLCPNFHNFPVSVFTMSVRYKYLSVMKIARSVRLAEYPHSRTDHRSFGSIV